MSLPALRGSALRLLIRLLPGLRALVQCRRLLAITFFLLCAG
jgi:hypothetical protein